MMVASGFDENANQANAEYADAHAATSIDSVEAYTDAAIEERRKKRSQKRLGIIAAVVVAVLLAVYAGGATWFSSHFLPHSMLGGYDVSGFTADEATAMLDKESDDYVLHVSGDDFDLDVTTEDSGVRIDSGKAVQKAMADNENLAWPLYFVGQKEQDLSDHLDVTYDAEKFEKFVNKKVKAFNKKAAAPTSATISYDKGQKAFVVVPEKLGGKLDSDAVYDKVEQAAQQMLDSVELGEDELLRPDVMSDDKRLTKALDTANGMLGTNIQLTLGGLDWLKVNSDLISGWVVLGDDITPTLDDQAVRDWAGAEVGKVNTVGEKREFTTPRGDEVSVSGGSYGWQVDYEPFLEILKTAIADKTVGDVEVPCVQTAAVLPSSSAMDFGKRYVDVNLDTQHAVFYDGDEVIWESDIISGSPDGEHDTPKGTFMVNLKESPSKLVGENVEVTVTKGKGKNKRTSVSVEPEYETEVEYWMPFIGNAIGFHDATWQPDFGGSMYEEGFGSHGCVNLPFDAAEDLYKIIDTGTPVIVHD